MAFDDQVAQAAVAVKSLAGGEGFTAIVPNREKSSLTVLWKAPVPQELLDQASKPLLGLAVIVQPTQLSQDDLLVLSNKLLTASRLGVVPEIATVTGNADASGLVVKVPAETLARLGEAKVSSSFDAVVSVPVTVLEGEAPIPTERQNDSDPWYGGGMMEAPGFNPPDDLDPYLFCSTGFAAVTSGGDGRLLSARHCDVDGPDGDCNRDWKDGAHDNLTTGGAAVDCHAGDDTLLIDPIGGTDGWVFGGPYNASSTNSRYRLKVAGSDSTVQGQNVCTSGANSGEHCGLEVQNQTMVSWNCGSATCNGWTARRPEPSTEVANVGGDSGGPVYMNRSDGRVGARGIIYGGAGNTSCGNVRFAVSNCFSTVYFTDINEVLDHWSGVGLSIETQS